MGRIELIIGPMFSGKTSELIKRIRKFSFGKNAKKTIILKWGSDYRNDEKKNTLKTHDGHEVNCYRVPNQLTVNGKIIPSISFSKLLKECDVIGIDEGHFFPEIDDLVTFCEFLSNEMDKIVIVTALNGDFRRKPFMEVLKLIPKCESVIKLNAVCTDCSSAEAAFTRKKVQDNQIIDVGGSEKYESVCRKCYFK